MTIEGTLGLVPSNPLFCRNAHGKWEAAKEVDWISVVLPDLTSPAIASWGVNKIPALRAHHVPALVFPMRYLVRKGTTRPVDLIYWDEESKSYLGVVIFSFEHLNFGDQVSEDQLLKFDDGVYEKQERPGDLKESSSLWWVPRMVELQSSYCLVNEHYDPTKARDLSNTKVRGTVLFRRGHLTVADFNLTKEGEIRPWIFGSVEWKEKVYAHCEKLKRAIGNSLKFTVKLRGREIDLWFTRRMGQSRLRLRGSCWGREISLSVLNVEPEVAASLANDAFHGFGKDNPGDPDFDSLFTLREVEVEEVSLVKSIVPIDPGSGITNKGRPCAPVLYDGFGGIVQ